MASEGENQSSEVQVSEEELGDLKRDLEGWREVLLPLRGLLMWEQPYHPAILFGVTTVVFTVLWYLEPSVLTTFAVLGLVLTCLDFAVPMVGPRIFANKQWTGTEERQFEEICERILHCKIHLCHFFQGLAVLKSEKPKIYFLVIMGVLSFCAWIGYVMNNLCLTYIIVLIMLMVPGLRQKGILQKYFLKYWLIVKRLLFGRLHVLKEKKTE